VTDYDLHESSMLLHDSGEPASDLSLLYILCRNKEGRTLVISCNKYHFEIHCLITHSVQHKTFTQRTLVAYFGIKNNFYFTIFISAQRENIKNFHGARPLFIQLFVIDNEKII
jgi:hypothetical protein